MIHIASENNSEVMFASLIANGCDVNQQDINGNTPLHLAAASGNLRLVQSLVQNGADFAMKNHHQQTPAMMASAADIKTYLDTRFLK